MKILTTNELEQIVPAAFATGPSLKASERYAFIPTYELIDQIRERGWVPVRAFQSKKMMDTDHAMHSITFRDPNKTDVIVGEALPEIVLINSHDLSRRWSLMAGIFRGKCSNGLVVSMGMESKTQRIHLDDANVDIDKALEAALNKLDESVNVIKRWQTVELPWLTVQEFARDAILIKNGGDAYWSKHFQPHEFLRRRREEDKPNDLWTVYNVVQENIMRGGVQGVTRETRPITQVREVVRINQDLWQLADKYGKLHGKN